MMIRVLFFGATADMVGKRDVPFEVHEPGEKFIDSLLATYPQLASHKLLVSINHQYAASDPVVKDGDEVGIFTAVSGG